MTEEEREAMRQAQKESWVRAELGHEPLHHPRLGEPHRASAFRTILQTIVLAALFLVTLWLAVEVGAGVARMIIELEALQATAADRARW